MAGIKPNNFSSVPVTGSTELYTQTNGENGKFTVDELKTYLDSEWTETEIILLSSDILNMGDAPVALLPGVQTGQYYNIDYILVEYDATDGAYVFPDKPLYIYGDGFYCTFYFTLLPTKCAMKLTNNSTLLQTDGLIDHPVIEVFNIAEETLKFYTWDNTNPSGGTGTIKFKIRYKIETFG